jgi:hypothetical protein
LFPRGAFGAFGNIMVVALNKEEYRNDEEKSFPS